jgi:hypothetical protein
MANEALPQSKAPRWLSVHVPYACRHSGACCGAGWPLPVERASVTAIDRAVATGQLETIDRRPMWLVAHPDAPAEMAGHLRLHHDARCVFHHREGRAGHACAVHTALGHDALPATCQHFPRICLIDSRGVHVTLSHYCPTAAALLFDHYGPVVIVDGPAAVAGRDVPEGLDARDALPPLLTSHVLMDWDGYTAWERHMVETLAGERARGWSAEDAVKLLVSEARTLAGWRPGVGTLAAAVAALEDGADRGDLPSALDLFEQARASCRDPWTWPHPPEQVAELETRLVAPGWPAFDAPVRRYLAAHAFAAWGAYQGGTLVAVVTAVGRALAVLRTEAARLAGASGRVVDRPTMMEAVRRADRLLRHYADPARMP